MPDEPQVVERQDAETDDPIVAALLRERAGYIQRDLHERVAQVDEQLALRSHTGTTAPKRRRAPAQQTR